MSKARGSNGADESDFESVTIYLAHLERQSITHDNPADEFATTTTTKYTLTPVEVRRPVTGFRRMTTVVRCGRCGKEIRCVGCSPSYTRWRRRRRYAIGWAEIAFALAAWSFVAVKGARYGSASVKVVTAFLFVLIVVGGIFALPTGIGLLRRDRDDSIGFRPDGRHSRRAAGDSYEVSTHTSPPRDLL